MLIGLNEEFVKSLHGSHPGVMRMNIIETNYLLWGGYRKDVYM